MAVHPLCFLAMAASAGGKTKLEKARAILGLPPAPSKHAKHSKASKDAAGAKPPDVSKSILPLAVADPSLTDAASASFSEADTAKVPEIVSATSEASDLLSAAPSLPSATDAACAPSTTAEVAGGPSAAADAACASSTMVDAACAPSAKDSEEVTLAAADLTAQIQARADSVEQDREWTSLFDLVVYAFLRKRRVHCCFGAQIVDIVNVFAPWLGPSLDDTKPIARFVGCVCKGGKLLVSKSKDGAFPRMNHWIIGVPVPGFCIDIVAEGAPPSVSAKYTDAGVAAGKVGWHVKPTDATGNCGVDAMTYFDGGERDAEGWKATREELAQLMREISALDLWHDCFKACQEAKCKPKVADPKVADPKPSVATKPSLASSLKRKAAGALRLSKASAKKAVCLVSPKASKEDSISEFLSGIEIPDETTHSCFEDWINLDTDKAVLLAALKSYSHYELLRDLWLKKHPGTKASRPQEPPKREYHPTKEIYRNKVANLYLRWRGNEGKNSKQPQSDFLRTIRVYENGKVAKKDKSWLRRLLEADRLADAACAPKTGHGNSSVYAAPPAQFRMRSHKRQGRPIKCADIDAMLWDWFVTMRSSFATTVSPKYVLHKARHFANMVLQDMKKTGVYVQLPKLDSCWLCRWKKRHGVVWRKPNCKYKVGWETLKVRCAATWQNIQRVQQLGLRVLGRELPVEGIDEKPIHFNEAGSKDVRTLEIKGAGDVELKQNHANTRERATVMTSTTSDKKKAARPEQYLPLELMKKAGSARTLKGIKLPKNMSVAVTWSPKGSYRHEDILGYIRRWCPEWSEARAAAKDYRIMLLDVARSHIGNAIVDELWSRGYICLYHYGGVTGVIQVNDTDNHAQFEREYLEFEERSFIRRQEIDSSDIGREFQEVVDDAIATWQVINHEQCAQGYKTTGLTVALPKDGELHGPEDEEIGRAARKVWEACGMLKIRRDTLDQVNKALDDKVKAGDALSMDLWRSLVQHPKNPGVLPEGFEFEGELLPGERPWIDAADSILAEQEGRLEEALDASIDPLAECVDFAKASDLAKSVLAAVEGEEPAVVEEATLAAREIAKCERLRAWAVSMKMPLAAREASQKKSHLLRKYNPKTAHSSLKTRLLLQRSLRLKLEAECAEREKRQQQAREQKLLQAKIRAAELDGKVVAELKAEEKAKVAKKLAELPAKFSATECGQGLENGGGKKHQTHRQQMLEHLKLRAPKLPPALELLWPKIRDNYCRQVAKLLNKNVGSWMVKEVCKVVDELGKHFSHPKGSPFASTAAGNPRAFEVFVGQMRSKWPEKKDATETPPM